MNGVEIVAAFDREQQEILQAMGRALEVIARTLVHEAERRSRVQIAALRRLLVEKGVATDSEIENAMRELEAAIAVDEALNPEIQAAEEELRRIMERLNREPGDTEQR